MFDYGTAGAGFPSALQSNPNQFVGVWSADLFVDELAVASGSFEVRP